MSESVQDVNQETSIDKPAESIQTTPITAEEVASLRKLLDDQKKEISGLNRKITESEKELKQKELEKLSEKERAKAELDLIVEEKKKIENEVLELSRGRIIDKALFDAGIPPEFAKRIRGNEEADILQDVKEFKDFIDNLVKVQSEKVINEKLGGKAPVSGSVPVSNDLQSQYNKAKTENNFTLQTAIKRQAQKEGVTIID